MKIDIRELSQSQIEQFVVQHNEKSFRAKQIEKWLWQRGICNFDLMTDLSVSLRNVLKENFEFKALTLEIMQKSKDKTIKVAYRLFDNHIIEAVLIPSKERLTACISTQIGCQLKCSFCATGQMKFVRNLYASEIFLQVTELNALAVKEFNDKISNIVIMGMGEPLLNYGSVMWAIEKMTSPQGLAMSPSRITLSTAGIVEKIRQMADDEVKFNLAISLHTADNEKRSSLMPINLSNPLSDLSEALIYFHQKTNQRITFEYLLIDGFNDTINDAKKLAVFCRNFPSKINVIEYNATDAFFSKAKPERLSEFVAFLESKNMVVNVRHSKGDDIDAACGQLANKISK